MEKVPIDGRRCESTFYFPVTSKANARNYFLLFLDISAAHSARLLLQLLLWQQKTLSAAICNRRWQLCFSLKKRSCQLFLVKKDAKCEHSLTAYLKKQKLVLKTEVFHKITLPEKQPLRKPLATLPKTSVNSHARSCKLTPCFFFSSFYFCPLCCLLSLPSTPHSCPQHPLPSPRSSGDYMSIHLEITTHMSIERLSKQSSMWGCLRLVTSAIWSWKDQVWTLSRCI